MKKKLIILLLIISLTVFFYIYKKMIFEKFKNLLGLSESSNNYNANNGIAFGRYQFTKPLIQDIADSLQISTPSVNDFLRNPKMQDLFFETTVKKLEKKILSDEFLKNQIGKTITGKKNNVTTTINIHGLIAGAWIGGLGGLNKLFAYGEDAYDGNTYVSDYIAKFSKYFNAS